MHLVNILRIITFSFLISIVFVFWDTLWIADDRCRLIVWRTNITTKESFLNSIVALFVYITFGNVTSRTSVALPDAFSDGDIVVTETKRTFAGNPADIAALNYFTSIFTTDPNIKNCSPEDLTIIEDIIL